MNKNVKMILLLIGIVTVVLFDLWLWLVVTAG
jgi:hypothetical protein